jgi:lysophospholipase L1-like esterase
MRARFGEVTRHQFHDHQDVRLFSIRAALGEADQPIVVIGDSFTEMSRLPETINGRPVVNAGIGGATISDVRAIAPRMLEGSNPSLIVVQLGANGAGSIQQDYAALLRQLRKWCPRLLAIAVTPISGSDAINITLRAAAQSEGVQFVAMPMPEGSTLADHVHLNAAGYRIWTPALVAAIVGATS